MTHMTKLTPARSEFAVDTRGALYYAGTQAQPGNRRRRPLVSSVGAAVKSSRDGPVLGSAAGARSRTATRCVELGAPTFAARSLPQAARSRLQACCFELEARRSKLQKHCLSWASKRRPRTGPSRRRPPMPGTGPCAPSRPADTVSRSDRGYLQAVEQSQD